MRIRLCSVLAGIFLVFMIRTSESRNVDTFDLNEFYFPGFSYLRDNQNGVQEHRHPQPIEVEWPKEPLKLGQVAGVAVQKDGNVNVFHRGGHVWGYESFNETDHYLQRDKGSIQDATILLLDKETGKILSSRGQNMFYLPHGISLDRQGNVWVTDVALHQVFRLPPNSDKPSLVLGQAFVPGNDNSHFCKPTDVAVASNGDFFISDGYCNSRIMKFSADGKLISEWGNAHGRHDFLVPHSITLLEDQDLVCVADRENKRVACYSAGLGQLPPGRFYFQVHDPHMGRVFAVTSHGTHLFAVTGPTAGLKPTGFTIDVSTQMIVNRWQPELGFSQPHDVDVSRDGKELYVSEIGPNNVRKFKIQP